MEPKDGQETTNGARAYGASSDEIEQTGNKEEEETAKFESAGLLNEFSTKTWREDLMLSLEGRQLYVNSFILALASPVFSEMFEEAFKSEVPKELELAGSYEDFVEFLRCFYPRIMKPITMRNVHIVAPLAHQYQAEKVTKLSNQFLIDAVMNGISSDEFCPVIQLAWSYQLVDLKRTCEDEYTRRDDLEAAVIKSELSQDIKFVLQPKKVVQLKECLAVKSGRCEVLENAMLRGWSETLKIDDIETAELCCIDIITHCRDCRRISKTTGIRNLSWTVHANIERKYVRGDVCNNLRVNITAEHKTASVGWSCKAHASCCVSYGKHQLWKQVSDGTMASKKLLFDFNRLDNFKFSSTQELKISVCILVGDIMM